MRPRFGLVRASLPEVFGTESMLMFRGILGGFQAWDTGHIGYSSGHWRVDYGLCVGTDEGFSVLFCSVTVSKAAQSLWVTSKIDIR